MSISLIKEREIKVGISLKKFTDRKIVANTNLIMDGSGSMDSAYRSGEVQDIVERIYPIASKFTTDGRLGVYVFSDDYEKLPDVTINNYVGYVKREIVNAHLVSGGTNYAPVIEAVLDRHRYTSIWERILGWFGIAKHKNKIPTYNIFITDGANSDPSKTASVMRIASKFGLFWQFVGIESKSFLFLEKLDTLSERFLDNANFFQIDNIASLSDEELYDKLLKEFPDWIDAAERNNILA